VTVATYYHGIRLATDTDAVYAWGGDAELGAMTSSYIGPTTTASVTRNADVLTFASSGNVSGTEGTIYTKAKLSSVVSGENQPVITGSNAGAPWIYKRPATTSATIYDGTAVVNDGTWNDTNAYGIGASWSVSGSSRKMALNGGAVTSGGFDGDMNVAVNMEVGKISGTYLYGHLKNLRIWNRAFTDAELVTISTP
jgi:hypothetical protein